MRMNTLITLGASAAFGIMAVLLARGWINKAVEKEFRQSTPLSTATPVPTQLNTVPVLIADMDLAFGDNLALNAVRLVNYPEDAVPTGAFTAIEDLFDNQGERVVLSQIAYNEPILEHKITGPNGRASLSARIRPGYRAVAVRVDDVSGVAGFVVPGDIVDIIYTREPETAVNGRKNGPGAAATAYVSDVILQNVTVLGVDQNQSETTAAPDVARTVTLEVTNEEGQALSLAMEYGSLSLSLRGVGEILPSAARQLKLSDLGPKYTRPRAQHTKRKTVSKQAEPKPSNVAEVVIIRSDSDKKETVERLNVKREITVQERTANEATTLLSELAGG